MIFLHGLGDSAEGFYDSFAEEEWTPNNCRVVLPTAPTQAVTLNGGIEMNSWFDIYNVDSANITDA